MKRSGHRTQLYSNSIRCLMRRCSCLMWIFVVLFFRFHFFLWLFGARCSCVTSAYRRCRSTMFLVPSNRIINTRPATVHARWKSNLKIYQLEYVAPPHNNAFVVWRARASPWAVVKVMHAEITYLILAYFRISLLFFCRFFSLAVVLLSLVRLSPTDRASAPVLFQYDAH